MERGRGRGRRLGTKASRPMLDFEGDDKEKVSPEKVQSKLDAFTVRQDELKAPVQVSTRDGDKDYDPQEEDDDDDDEVSVVTQRVTGRTLRLVKRHIVDEESIALDIRLGKFGLNPAELQVMSKDDKKQTLQIFQQSQQDNEVTQQKKRAFCKEADIDYEDLELEQGNVAKSKRSKSEAISAAQGAPDEDETQAPEDDFMTFGQTLDEDAAHKGHYENGADGSQHGDADGEEAGIGNPQDEEETQPYELEQDLITRLVTKKRSFQQVQEADENNEAIPKKSKVEEDGSPRPRFHFEYDENEELPPPSPIPAKLVNKRRLKQKRPKRPFLMFTPSGQSPAENKKKIIEYFDEYFLTLREFQSRSSTMIEWGDPVCERRSMPYSLDVFSCKPARPVYMPAKPLFSDGERTPPKQKTLTIDDMFGFESLDEPKPSNSRADRYEKRNRHKFGEYEDIIEEDDFTRDPDFTMASKPAPKKGRGKGRGKNSSSKTVKDAGKSPVFDKSAAAGAANSDEKLPDLIIESDDTPPLPVYYGDNNSIDFDSLAADQSAATAATPQLSHGGSDEDSDSVLAPTVEKTDTNSRSVESTRGGVNIGLGRSKSPIIMDSDEEEDNWKSCAGKKRSSFIIDDSAKQRIKVALKTSCENISSSRENSQNEETDKKVNIPAQKLTLTEKIKRTIQSIVRPATKLQEDKTREAAEYDLNRRPGGVQTVRASDDNSPQASQDLFSNDTQDDPIPSPTFPGRGRHIGGSDFGTDGSKSHVKSSGPVLPGGFVRTKNEPNSEFDEPEWFVQEQDPDAAMTNYLDKSEADVKRTARPKRGGSRSVSNGARDKPAPQHVDSKVNVTRTKVELSDDEDDVQVHHKKQSVCRRKNAACAAVEKTHRGDGDESVMVASLSRGTGRRVIRPPQKKRKVETEAIPVLESEEEEEPVPEIVHVEPQVDCPLCGDPYPQSRIEVHASECDGISQKSDKRQTRSSANTQESQQPDRRNRQTDARYREMTARFSSSDSDSDVLGPPSPPASLYGIRSVVPDHRPQEDLFDMVRQMTVPRRARQPKPVVDGEACYICDGIFSKGKEYEEHVNSCMDAQQEQQKRIMQSFSKERSQSVDNVDGGGEPGQSGHERQSNSDDDDASEESGSAGDSDSSDATTGEDDNHDHDDPGPAFKREDANDFDWDNISSSPIKTFRPFSKHQGRLLIDLNKQFPHQRKTVELNNQGTLSEFGVRGGARGRGRGRGRGAKKPTKRKRKTKQKTKSRKKAKTVKKGPPPVHFS